MVSRIVIYNRPDCCQDRLNGAKIKILDSSRKQIYPTIVLTGERLQEFMIRTLPKGQTCGSEGENVFVNNLLPSFHFTAQLLTIKPEKATSDGVSGLKKGDYGH